MAVFAAGTAGTYFDQPQAFAYSTRIAAYFARTGNAAKVYVGDYALSGTPAGAIYTYVNALPAEPANQVFVGCLEERLSYCEDWFEKFHVRPTSFIFGNVLTTQQVPVSVYSAYRTEEHDWDAFTNNAGDGVELLNQPTYSYTFPPQTGYAGLVLEVTPNGPPFVESTLDFVFDTMTISPVIELERLVLFDLPPELPYTELLEFLTEIQPRRNGSEYRLALRKNPRQYFEWELILEDSLVRSRIHNQLFDWQARVFGVPVWHEATFTDAAVAVDDLVVNVRTTSYADYREGGLFLIYESASKYDVLELASGGLGATDLTATNGVQNTYDAGTLVMPLRTGVLSPSIRGARAISDVGQLSLRFRVTENDNELADVSAWTSYNSKVVLDDVNSTGGSGNSVAEEFLRDLIVIDNEVGLVDVSTLWDQSKRLHTKTFWTKGKAELWKVRQLLHALRGRQVSFYLPTHGQDLTPVSDLLSAGSSLTVTNVGYARYVQNRQTRNIIKVTFNNGDPALVREITASSEVDADTETLTVDSPWPSTYTPSEVSRIEYLELSRFESDSFRFRYSLGERTCRISAPVITVFDE